MREAKLRNGSRLGKRLRYRYGTAYGEAWRGMKPGKEGGRRPAKVWVHARWVSLVPALILIFFVASATISPRTTQAVDEPADPIIPATTVPTDTPAPPAIVAPTPTDQPTATPVSAASGLTSLSGGMSPTATPI